MRYIMRKICLFPVMIAVIVFTGCGQKKNEDPVTVTLWHVYGGQTESPLNDLIDEFNETIGKEKNIRVQVGSVTNTNTIHENVLEIRGLPNCRICLFPIPRQFWRCRMIRSL